MSSKRSDRAAKRAATRAGVTVGVDRQVQGTNDSSIVSKQSMCALKYFDDPYVNCMIVKAVRRAPLINRGYYVRAKAIEFVVNKFLEGYINKDIVHIVSFGAGFDTTYFRLKTAGKLRSCVYVEIDFMDVALRKAHLIRNNELLHNCLIESNESPVEVHDTNYLIIDRRDYKLMGVNLTQLGILEAALNAIGLDEDSTVLFLAECVMSYIHEKRTAALIQLLSQNYHNATFALYEQMHPSDGFGQQMMSHFRKMGAPLLSLDLYPNKEQQITRFLSKGWRFAEAIDMNEFYFCHLSPQERTRVENREIFDEYEEFHLMCNHYFVLVAQTAPPSAARPLRFFNEWPTRLVDVKIAALKVIARVVPSDLDESGWCVHAHSCVAFNDSNGDRWLMRVNGYGRDPMNRNLGHRRLNSITMVKETGGQTQTFTPAHDEYLNCSIFASASRISDDSLLIFGGRTSPFCSSSTLVYLKLTQNMEEKWQGLCINLGERHLRNGPCARWRHSTCVFFGVTSQVMLVVGGRDSGNIPLEDAYLYDVQEDSWRRTSPLPTGGIASASLTVVDSTHAVLSGGVDFMRKPSQFLWLFSLESETWAPFVNVGKIPLEPRFCHTAHLLSSQQEGGHEQPTMVFIGGISACECYSQNDQRVTLVRLDIASRRMVVDGNFSIDMSAIPDCSMLFSHGSIMTQNNEVLICGGGGNCFSFGTHLNRCLIALDIQPLLAAHKDPFPSDQA